jgi:butyryl-CoA dehydrogenase
MEGGKGLQLVAGRINRTIEAAMQRPELAEHANALAKALQQVGAATKAAWATGEPSAALANAVPYMQAFGHVVLAWIWLDVLLTVPAQGRTPAQVGRVHAARYFFHYELPKIGAWLRVVQTRDPTCADMPEEAF